MVLSLAADSSATLDTFAGNLLFIDNASVSVVMCTVSCVRSYCENVDRFVHITSWQAVSISVFLSVASRRHLNCFRTEKAYGTRTQHNTTQASTLSRRATICLRSQQGHNAAPHRGLLIESRVCSNTSLFRCRYGRHLVAPLTIQGRGGSLIRPD